MDDAKWVVDATTGLLSYVQNGSEYDYLSRRSMHPDGYDALVAAVRDSERLPAVTAERDEWRTKWQTAQDEIDALNDRRDLLRAERDKAEFLVEALRPWLVEESPRRVLDLLAASSRDTERVTPEQAADAHAALALAEEALHVPFDAYVTWRESGSVKAADRMSEWEARRNAARAAIAAARATEGDRE